MNVGFFGIQYSFGLQQGNMSPIYRYLGADEASLPLLWLAGPMTGLLVQPIIGAVFSISSISWTVRTTPELPLTDDERARILAQPHGLGATLREVADAARDMRATMKQLALVYLFQWYAMFCYWQYIVLSFAATLFRTHDASSAGFREAGLVNGQIGGFYNFVAFVAALGIVPFTRRFGAKAMHTVCLVTAGAAMLAIPAIDNRALLFVPMLGVGLGWASMIGNPYVMLAGSIPAERVGVYMGIFNMFIVIPMMIQIFTVPLIYRSLLGGRPENVVRRAGSLLLCAAVACVFVRVGAPRRSGATELAGATH